MWRPTTARLYSDSRARMRAIAARCFLRTFSSTSARWRPIASAVSRLHTTIVIFVDRKRKQKVPEPVEISQLQRVKVINILGGTITNGLSVSPHIQSVIASCAQASYALRVLRAHGLCDRAFQFAIRNSISKKISLSIH